MSFAGKKRKHDQQESVFLDDVENEDNLIDIDGEETIEEEEGGEAVGEEKQVRYTETEKVILVIFWL